MVLSVLGAPGRALADDDATATAAARERFKEGVAYFDEKQYEKARAAFVQAYALKKHPSVLLNLAQSELRSNHERDAAQHFAQYLREAGDAAPAQREAAQSGLTSAKAAICELTVTTDPDADVSVDGAAQGTSPLPGPLYLDPGTHTLQIKKGDRVSNQSVTAKAGESRELKIKLTEPAPAAAPKPAPTTAPTDDQAAPPPAEDVEHPAPREAGREPFLHWLLNRPAGVITGGATVLLAGGAVGFAIASNSAYSESDDIAQQIDDRARADNVSTQGICVDPNKVLGPGNEDEATLFTSACTARKDAVDRGDSYKTVAMFVGIGAGVMAAATVTTYFLTTSSSGDAGLAGSHVAVVPWISPGNGGVSVSGRF